jgi:hypothetical protein
LEKVAFEKQARQSTDFFDDLFRRNDQKPLPNQLPRSPEKITQRELTIPIETERK